MKLPLIGIVSQYLPALHSPAFEGVARYCGKFGPWRFCQFHMPSRPEVNCVNADLSKTDGILAFNFIPAMERFIRESGKPAVAVTTAGDRCGIPAVTYDEQAIGRMACEHLADLGLARVGFAGFATAFSRQRGQGFLQTIKQRGLQDVPPLDELRIAADWENLDSAANRRLRTWLKSLEMPVGLFCASDSLAVAVARMCLEVGLQVPEQVSIVGVDNLTWLCETAVVPLSSIDRNTERAGYEAASLLHRLLRGQSSTPQFIRIPPAQVVTRRSTEMLDPHHPEYTRAIHFIRDHACDGITIQDLLRAVPVSRSSLHRMFKRYLGTTPGDEIQRHRLERAKRLLEETDIPLADVAVRCGFGWSSCLGRAFRERYQITPDFFRRQTRSMPIEKAILTNSANRPRQRG